MAQLLGQDLDADVWVMIPEGRQLLMAERYCLYDGGSYFMTVWEENAESWSCRDSGMMIGVTVTNVHGAAC